MEKQQFEFTLFSGHKFKGYLYSEVQLSARFQVWCRKFGIDDEASLCLWLHSMPYDPTKYTYLSQEKRKQVAENAVNKLPTNKNWVDFSENYN